MATFLNPNHPQQPQPGVYGWFVHLSDGGRCIYIGQAGARRSAKEKGTLLRGVTELFRETFSSDSPHYQLLDTDFVVGTAIRFFERHHGPVFWEHLSNDPKEEGEWLQRYAPLLQHPSVPEILPQLKIRAKQPYYWKWPRDDIDRCRAKICEAEERICDQLTLLLAERSLLVGPPQLRPPASLGMSSDRPSSTTQE